jgi:pimeloyl-ACP methyl ester carboxylesterase
MSLMKIFTRTAVLSFGLAMAIGAAAEATPLASDSDMVTGVSVTEADCRAQISRLWVKVENRGFCVRFWLSTAGGNKDEALVAFHGDIGGMIDGKLQLEEQARSISDESLQKAADYGSRLYRGPYFFIARPGAFGSSGNHVKDRRTLLEIRVAMAALDALKQHYGFKRFHLVGHSGGGHTVAGLVQLRSDIGCAVLASAPISLRSQMHDRFGRPLVGKLSLYDPIDHVSAMKPRPDLHLFVVSDRNDKVVSYRSQLEFVERVKAHNLAITHVAATATDKNSHGLFNDGLRLAVDCAHRDQDVANNVSPRPVGVRINNVTEALSERAITLKKGDSAATILRDLGASAEDISALTTVLGARGRDGGLREGEKLRILFAPDAGRLRIVRVVVAGDSAIEAVVALSATGKYVSIMPSALSGVLAPPPLTPNPSPPQMPPASQPVGQPPTQSDTAQPNSPVFGPVAPVAQKVVLYDEDPSDPKGKQYVGTVVWRTEPIKASGSQKADMAVRADIEIPDRKFKMTMSFRRNTDSSLPASHIAELTFMLPSDFPGGSVANVPGILMKSNEQARGTPLAGLAVKVTDGFFLVGLSNTEADRPRNVQLLKERSWFDVPLVYTNQRRAIIAIEKGASGERTFRDAITAWGENFPIASTDAPTRVQSFERTALSDARTSVQTYYSLTPDCNQSGIVTVRVLKQPSHGTLEIARDRGFTNYAADNIRAKCNAQEVELTRVWYKSNIDFKGRDQAQLEAFFTSGISIETTLQITVK